jgi:hypothetical protein
VDYLEALAARLEDELPPVVRVPELGGDEQLVPRHLLGPITYAIITTIAVTWLVPEETCEGAPDFAFIVVEGRAVDVPVALLGDGPVNQLPHCPLPHAPRTAQTFANE